MKQVHMIVEGTVQGVGFRYSAQEKAKEFNVYGWVKNLDNGSVEIEAEGKDDNVDAYVEAIKHGPSPYAKVSNVLLTETNNENRYETFEIKH